METVVGVQDRKYWVAVASANHVARGIAGRFMQVNHGKLAPLKRIRAGDVVMIYSPLTEFGGSDKLMAFTAIGTVLPGEPYQGDMGQGFKPFRRDVDWVKDAEWAPIRELLPHLSFTARQSSWGYKFRFGLFEITAADAALIARVMKAVMPETAA